jgi:hypothetical protein
MSLEKYGIYQVQAMPSLFFNETNIRYNKTQQQKSVFPAVKTHSGKKMCYHDKDKYD